MKWKAEVGVLCQAALAEERWIQQRTCVSTDGGAFVTGGKSAFISVSELFHVVEAVTAAFFLLLLQGRRIRATECQEHACRGC